MGKVDAMRAMRERQFEVTEQRKVEPPVKPHKPVPHAPVRNADMANVSQIDVANVSHKAHHPVTATTTYRYRDAEKRRLYMRNKMREKRAAAAAARANP